MNMQQQSNSNFQQQSPNVNMQQPQSFNQQFQNSNMNQQFQSSSMNQQFYNQSMQQQINTNNGQQYSNVNIPQQCPNMQNQIQNQSIQQQFCDQNIQKSSTVNIQQPNPEKKTKPTSMFPVIYRGTTFLVDPAALYDSSIKFKELIQPYIQDIDQLREMHLDILNVQFSKRNVNNFLRLCQKLPTDVKNSEMTEICEIAKMFKAEEIYKTGITFIQENLDANFFVSDNKYDGTDGKTYLIVQGDTNGINHDPTSENVNTNTIQNQPNEHENQNSEMDHSNNNEAQQKDNFDLNDHSKLHDPVFGLDNADNITKKEDNEDEPSEPNGTASKEDQSTELENNDCKPVIYYVRVENHTFKCPVFKFVKDNRIIYTAKQKYEEIYIGEGSEIHIRNKENHVAHITQNDISKINKVHTKSTDFLISYVNSGAPEHFSLDVSFPFERGVVNWIPKPPKYDPNTNKYYLNFHGTYKHTPVISSKNIVLQDKNGKPTFIVRKMDRNVYEIECQPIVDPLIVFTIGLSDIVGPYLDPYTNIDYFD